MTSGEIFKLIVDQISLLTLPMMFFLIIGYAMTRRVKVYEEFIEGGKEGWEVFIKILPYIIAILAAIGMFRESGALEIITDQFAPALAYIGMPKETLPVALMKPLSGSGSLGIVSEVVESDPDSFKAKVASTMFGSTDTTFYVIALYFGSVGIRKIRHAMLAGLTADLAGILAAVGVCHLVFDSAA
jgi:spore maturation protein B